MNKPIKLLGILIYYNGEKISELTPVVNIHALEKNRQIAVCFFIMVPEARIEQEKTTDKNRPTTDNFSRPDWLNR